MITPANDNPPDPRQPEFVGMDLSSTQDVTVVHFPSGTMWTLDDIDIYRSGLAACSVCVPEGMTREEVETLVNLKSPTGIDSGWSISADEKFAGGYPNPGPCRDVAGRAHYLLNC